MNPLAKPISPTADTDAAPRSRIAELLTGVKSHDKRAIAGLFNLIEDRRSEVAEPLQDALDGLWRGSLDLGHVIGITGPPGAGKSSLVSRLISAERAQGRSVGVIAVDPSSRTTGGALLGDRIRFEYDVSDPGVFVRSMASRGDQGGLSDRTFAGMVLLRSAFDVTFVETVGIGQSECDIADLVDTTLLVIQPGSGDMLQFLKAGIMETPHLLVVNKSDLGASAIRAYNDLRAALAHGEPGDALWAPALLLASAAGGSGIDAILAEACRHLTFLKDTGGLDLARSRQAGNWILQALLRLNGTRGLERRGGAAAILESWQRKGNDAPFSALKMFANDAES